MHADSITADLRRRRFVGGGAAALALWPLGGLASSPAAGAAEPPQAVEEAPYVQTPPALVRRLLQLADLRPGELLWDLGSGDGRIVIAAARDFGARGVGYDIDAALVEQSRASARRARLGGRARFFERDVLTLDFSGAAAPEVVTLYLLPELNLALKPKLLEQLRPGARVLSVDWDMGADWPPDETLVVPYAGKPHGRERSYRLMLWVVPAAVGGRWRVGIDAVRARLAGALGQRARAELDGLQLAIAQQRQQLTVQAERGQLLWAQLRGTTLELAWRDAAAGSRPWRLQGTLSPALAARQARPAERWRGSLAPLGAWGNSDEAFDRPSSRALRFVAERLGD